MEATKKKKQKEKLSKKELIVKIKKYKFMYFLLLPAIIYTIVFNYLTMGGVIIAFQDYDIIKGILGSKFVGFSNFGYVFQSPKILHAIKNTLIISTLGLFGGTPFPILLAILLNELRANKFKRVTQTISYLPHFLSWISVAGMFSSFFATYGTFNDIMVKILGESYQRTNILMDAKYFVPILFWTGIWKGIGWNSIIYLSSISGIDPTLYEAATVDGCGKVKQAFYITLPCIAPTIIIIFIMSIGGILGVGFEQVFMFQNIYTQEETEVIDTLVYRMGIQNAQYSLTTAFGLTRSLISFLLTYVTNWLSKKVSGTGIW